MTTPCFPAIRTTRRAAGLTQRQLAERLGITQSAVARLESPRANPRVGTIERAVRACGHELVIQTRPHRSSIDETLIAENLKLTPGERLAAFEHRYAGLREFALAARKSMDELA